MSLAVAVPWSLPGRPAEHSPAQHVQMYVVHRLAGACIHVEYSAVAFFVDIRLHSKFLGDLENLADERAVLRLQIIQCRNVLLGHHQEMNGSLRPKILKCYDAVVLMHKVRECFVLNDSAKKTRLLHGFNLALLGVILCTTLLAGTSIFQNPAPTDSSAVNALQHSRAFRCAETSIGCARPTHRSRHCRPRYHQSQASRNFQSIRCWVETSKIPERASRFNSGSHATCL